MAHTAANLARVADRLAEDVEALARTVSQLPDNAPVPSRIREAGHILADVAEALRHWDTT